MKIILVSIFSIFLFSMPCNGQLKIGFVDVMLIRQLVCDKYEVETTYAYINDSLDQINKTGIEELTNKYKYCMERGGHMIPIERDSMAKLLQVMETELNKAYLFVKDTLPMKKSTLYLEIDKEIQSLVIEYSKMDYFQVIFLKDATLFYDEKLDVSQQIAQMALQSPAVEELLFNWPVKYGLTKNH